MDKDISKGVIREMKKRDLTPRPRWQFLLKRWVFWLLAIISTILGGLAIAIIILVFIDHDVSARVYLEQSAFEDILLTIPYLWLMALAVLIGVTKYAVRHTKFGYRYTTARIVGAVLVGSMLLGIVLNAMDIGGRVQDFLVETAPYYNELTHTSKDAWSHPEKGLLGGTITTVVSSEEFELIDFRKKSWRVDTSEVEDMDDSIIQQGAMVKIVGTKKDSSLFRARQIFLWNN